MRLLTKLTFGDGSVFVLDDKLSIAGFELLVSGVCVLDCPKVIK